MPKKQPGAQPGNSNARRHGFYAAGVTTAMRNALRRARNLDDSGLAEEIPLARARLAELIRIEPENHEVLRHMLDTITRMVAVNHKLKPPQERALGRALEELLAELMPDGGAL